MQQQQKLGNFISKLQFLLSRPQYSQIICWDKSETMLDILSQEKMETEIIPLFFRHQKFESFVRQLNLYGFKKIKCNGRHRFTHPQLLKGEKLQSITSHKTSAHSRKQEKDQPHDMISQEKTSEILEKDSKKEKSAHPTLNPITQYQVHGNQDAAVSSNISSGCVSAIQDQGQLFSALPHSYFNYWNMFMMHPSNQFAPLLFVNQMPTLQ